MLSELTILLLLQWQMVLILVLMEDTLRVYNFDATEDHRAVLILVLMEDTLRACHRIICQYVCEVS